MSSFIISWFIVFILLSNADINIVIVATRPTTPAKNIFKNDVNKIHHHGNGNPKSTNICKISPCSIYIKSINDIVKSSIAEINC